MNIMNKLIISLLLLVPVSLFAQNIDINTLKAINSSKDLPSDGFFRAVSNTNIYVTVGVPVTMAVAGFATSDKDLLRSAAVVAAGSAVNIGITYALKYAVKRDRPFETYPDLIKNKSGHDYLKDPSFPSGHTSSAFATATGLSLEYPKWYVIVPSYLYAGTVAYSRMYLGVHYPSDVLTGAVIGSGCAWLSHYVNKKLNDRQTGHRR